MTKYFTWMSLPLYAEWQAERLTLPRGWRILGVVTAKPASETREEMVGVAVEDNEADPALEGLTVAPWFQHTVDGQVVIIEREVMKLEHNQIRME